MIAPLVLAIAAVAGTPPNIGITILPIPWATSSTSASIFSFFILPAEEPQRRDSISPNAAIEIAGVIKLPICAKSIAKKLSLSSRNNVFGIAPTVGTFMPQREQTSVERIIAINDEGEVDENYSREVAW